jgi:6-phosphogluconolactonase
MTTEIYCLSAVRFSGVPAIKFKSSLACLAVLLICATLHGQGQRFAFAYVTNSQSNSISAYSIDANTGALNPVSGAATGSGPSSIAIDPSGRFAYVANSNEGSISAYSVDPNTGILTELQGSPISTGLPPGPAQLTVHPTGKFLYVANNPTGVLAFSINTTTGILTQLPGSPYPTSSSGAIVMDPIGRFVFVGQGNDGSILAYSIDGTTGALTPVSGSPFRADGTSPEVGPVDPTGRFLYVSNNSGVVSGYAIDSKTGALSPVPGSPFPAESPNGASITPDGRFLYVPNRHNNDVSAYAIDSNTGTLSPLPGSPFLSGSGPIYGTIDPTGSFLYVVNLISDDVSVYAINANTGALSLIPSSPFAAGIAPVWITVANETPTSTLSILPTHGGNAGSVSAEIFGGGLVAGAQVKLVTAGQPEVVGSNTTLVSPNVLATTFDLTGAVAGVRDVIVTNPDGTSQTISSGFAVEEGGEAEITVDILGRDKIKIGTDQVYYLTVSNSGSADGLVLFDLPSSSTGTASSLVLSAGAPPTCVFKTPPVDIIGAGSTAVYPGVCQQSSSGCQTFTYNADEPSPGCPDEVEAVRNAKLALAFLENRLASAKLAKTSKEAQYQALGCATKPNDPICQGLKDEIDQLNVLISVLEARVQAAQDALAAALDALVKCLGNPSASSAQLSTPIRSLTIDQIVSGSISFCGVSSLDPNDKVGPSGIGSSRFTPGPRAAAYSVYFDNEPTATAPAQAVTVTDKLDTNLDLGTTILGPITFPNQIITPPGVPLSVSPFTTTVDLRPGNNLLVKVSASLDSATRILTWNFQSLDPTTSQPPADPLAGFLPPGAEGSVFFTVVAKQGLPTGTQVQNQASIVFDVNAALNTPTWMNTLDNTAPTSHVLPLPPQSSPSFTVQWTGTDVGAGIGSFTIFASDNGGSFTAFQTQTTATQAMFSGTVGHTYSFYSIATDAVGNVEPAKTAAEATTLVVSDTIPPTTVATPVPLPNANGWNNTNVVVTLTATDNPGGSGVKQIQYSLSGAQIVTLQTVLGNTVQVTISAEGTTTLTYYGTDNAGNVESPNTLTVKIDKTPPTISGLPAPGCTLSPPNHKFVQVATVTAADSLSGLASFNVTGTSNQPMNPNDPDIIITGSGLGPRVIQLRDERLGKGADRVYTLNATATDMAGNTATSVATCIVPHDQGN